MSKLLGFLMIFDIFCSKLFLIFLSNSLEFFLKLYYNDISNKFFRWNMYYKNTLKLFASNFVLVWKQVLYLLCCFFIFFLCSYTTIKPIVELLVKNNIGEDFKILFETVYNNPKEIFLMISDISKNILQIIATNFSYIYINLFLGFILSILLPYILIQMSIYNLSSVMYYKMKMNMNVGYTQNYFKNLKKSFIYALTSIVLSLPFLAIIVIFFELYLILVTSFLSALVLLVLFSFLAILVHSLKLSLFTYFTGHYITTSKKPFNSFKQSFNMIFKNFGKIISLTIALYLTIIFVNGVIGIFTLFAGLIITIPATFVIISIYNMVIFLSLSGDRYYLSETIIFNPKPYTIVRDDFVTISVPEVQNEINVSTTKIKRKYKK